jgi:hypothetical protein
MLNSVRRLLKPLFLILLCAQLLILCSCGDARSSLEKRMSGHWSRQGSGVYLIEKGTVAFEASGHVLARYEVVDAQTLKIDQNPRAQLPNSP